MPKNRIHYTISLAALVFSFSVSAETSISTPPVAPVAAAAESRVSESEPSAWKDVRFGFSVFFSLAEKLKMDRGTRRVPGEEALESNADTTMAKGYGVAIDMWRAQENSWGYMVGGSYEWARKMTGYRLRYEGASATDSETDSDSALETVQTFQSPQPRLSIFTAYGNGVYRFQKIYVALGLNYSFPQATDDYLNTSFRAESGLGGQAGAGYFFSKHVSGEIFYKQQSFKVKWHFDSPALGYTTRYHYDYAHMIGLQAGLRITY